MKTLPAEVEANPTRQPRYSVIGNHPILARPDKFGMTFHDAVSYYYELEKLGYTATVIQEKSPPVS